MNLRTLSFALLMALPLAVVACGSSDSDSSGDGAGGAAAGGSAGSSAGAGGSSAGAGGSSAGAGGSAGSSAGAGGSSAGAGGGTSGAQADVADCKFATAMDLSAGTAEISVSGTSYSPPCIKVKAGQTVTFKGSSTTHPLKGMVDHGTQPNPIVGPYTAASVPIAFPAEGAFGFHCTVHGGDKAPGSSGMSGAVYVVP